MIGVQEWMSREWWGPGGVGPVGGWVGGGAGLGVGG